MCKPVSWLQAENRGAVRLWHGSALWARNRQNWAFNRQNWAFIPWRPHFFPQIQDIQMYMLDILLPNSSMEEREHMWTITLNTSWENEVVSSSFYSRWWLCGRSGRHFGTQNTGTQRWPSPGCTFQRRRRPLLRHTSPRTSPGPWTLVFLSGFREHRLYYITSGSVRYNQNIYLNSIQYFFFLSLRVLVVCSQLYCA